MHNKNYKLAAPPYSKAVGLHDKNKRKLKNALFIIGLLIAISSFGQSEKVNVHDFPIPKDLASSFIILDKTLSADELDALKSYPEDSIALHPEFRHKTDFFHAWKIYKGSELTKYFNDKGLVGSQEIYETILISYHRYLNQKPIDLEGQIEKYKAEHNAQLDEYLKRTKQDSIYGVYIPLDIKDSFVTLDSLLSSSNKESIRKLPNREETIVYHHGLGTWIRNNWGLWGGSRLQLYFLNRNVEHPDSMSALILEYYYDWLHGKHSSWRNFDKK